VPSNLELQDSIVDSLDLLCESSNADYVLLWFPKGAEQKSCYYMSSGYDRAQVVQILTDQIIRAKPGLLIDELDKLGSATNKSETVEELVQQLADEVRK